MGSLGASRLVEELLLCLRLVCQVEGRVRGVWLLWSGWRMRVGTSTLALKCVLECDGARAAAAILTKVVE